MEQEFGDNLSADKDSGDQPLVYNFGETQPDKSVCEVEI